MAEDEQMVHRLIIKMTEYASCCRLPTIVSPFGEIFQSENPVFLDETSEKIYFAWAFIFQA